MTKRTIYLLKLENFKYFLLAYKEPITNIFKFFLESVIKYDYLKLNNPVEILDKYVETHHFDLDIIVKKKMLEFGIDNVRGGSYSSTNLDKHQISFLKKEIFPAKLTEGECPDGVIEEILNKYGSVTQDKISEIKTTLIKNYEKYQKEKILLESIQMDCSFYKSQLEWLLSKCQEQITSQRNTVLYKILNKEDIKTYREIIPIFKKIYQTFLTIYNIFDKDIKNVIIKHPEFVFDDFIYHGHRTHLPDSIKNVDKVISMYRYFLTYIENRLNELDFDISSWGANAEYIFPRAIYFLHLSTFTDSVAK
jgi:hypothetical protein